LCLRPFGAPSPPGVDLFYCPTRRRRRRSRS
jgi:hypothetical protein